LYAIFPNDNSEDVKPEWGTALEVAKDLLASMRAVRRGQTKGKKMHISYPQSIEIVIETIKWVLAKPDPEKYVLGWSG